MFSIEDCIDFVNSTYVFFLKLFELCKFPSVLPEWHIWLDFSDLYESGVAFDLMKSRLSIEDGLITFVEPLWIDGPSAKFQTRGTVNLVTEELDQQLIVTFPITSSLPLVAVLAGLAPQVAASIYVTEKLIGEELEQFTSARYNVSGTITEPKMKIDQAFNNELEGKESKSFTDRILNIFGIGDDWADSLARKTKNKSGSCADDVRFRCQ